MTEAEHPGRGGHLDPPPRVQLPTSHSGPRRKSSFVDQFELLGEDQEGLPHLLVRVPPGPDLAMPMADLALQRRRRPGNPFDIGAQVSDVTLDVPAVPGLERALHGLNVLLRHRPPSIPGSRTLVARGPPAPATNLGQRPLAFHAIAHMRRVR